MDAIVDNRIEYSKEKLLLIRQRMSSNYQPTLTLPMNFLLKRNLSLLVKVKSQVKKKRRRGKRGGKHIKLRQINRSNKIHTTSHSSSSTISSCCRSKPSSRQDSAELAHHAINTNDSNAPTESTIYLCGRCKTPVTWEDKDIMCETCNKWFHNHCQNINDSMYGKLGLSSAPWDCISCNGTNYSSILFDLYGIGTGDSDTDNSDLSLPSLTSPDRIEPKIYFFSIQTKSNVPDRSKAAQNIQCKLSIAGKEETSTQ